MALDGKRRKSLSEALLDGYRSHTDLQMMMQYGLDQNLEEIAHGLNLQETVLKLIDWAESRGVLNKLIVAAHTHNRGNQSIESIYKDIEEWSSLSPLSTIQEGKGSSNTPLWKIFVAIGIIIAIPIWIAGVVNNWFYVQDRLGSAASTANTEAVKPQGINNSISVSSTDSNIAIAGPGGNVSQTINNINPTAAPLPRPTATATLFASGAESENLVVIADFNAQNGEDPRRITQSLFEEIREELANFDDIRIERLYSSISEKSGSEEAMRIAESPKVNASIIIWGDYVDNADPELYIHYDIAKQPDTYLGGGFEEEFSPSQILQPTMFEFKLQLGSYLSQVTAFNIGLVLYNSNRHLEAIEYFEKAVEAVGLSVTEDIEAAILYYHASNYQYLGRALDAYAILIRLESWSKKPSSKLNSLYPAILNGLGWNYFALGRTDEAYDFYHQALEIQQEIGDHKEVAKILTNIGTVHSIWGESQKALEFYTRALPLRQESGDRKGEARTLNEIGTIYFEQDDNLSALDFYTKTLSIQREIGNKAGEARVLTNIGHVYSKNEWSRSESLAFYNDALDIQQNLGLRRDKAKTLNGMGLAYFSLGDKQSALDYFEQALPILREVGDQVGGARALNNIGLIYFKEGNNQEALKYFEEALRKSSSAGDRRNQASVLYNIGVLHSSQHEELLALKKFFDSLELFQNASDRRGEFITLLQIWQIYVQQGRTQQAQGLLREYRDIFRKFNYDHRDILLWVMKDSYEQRENLDKIEELLLETNDMMMEELQELGSGAAYSEQERDRR